MGIAQSVLMVQDNLTECFGKLSCDGIVFREQFNVFWVFTKTKIIFIRRPAWREHITAKTFPVSSSGFKTQVNTICTDTDGRMLFTANQEACVLDGKTHRPVKLTTLPYPSGPFPEPVFTEPFERFTFTATEDDFKYEHIIRSQHIDMSRHMNNIEYIKLALNVFTDDFLRTHDPQSLEVHYTGESTEGQTLRIYSTTNGAATAIAIQEGDRAVFEMKIVF